MTSKIVKLLNESKESEIEEFVKIIIPLLLAEFHQYNLNHNIQDLIAMEKIIIFLFLIIYNIKEKEKIKILFNYNDCIIIKTLKEILIFYKDSPKENFISKLILNICFDEYKEKMISYKDSEIDEIYNYIFNELFLCMLEAVPQFSYPPSYDKFIKNLFHCQIDTAEISKFNTNGNFTLLHSACESILVMMLLKEKFTKKRRDNNYNLVGFIENLIISHVAQTKEQYGNEYTSLFRKDDFSNLMIKYFFFSFGNDCFINAFYTPLSKHITFFEQNFTNEKEKFDTKNFEIFFDEFIDKLTETFPYILKVLLRLIDIEVKKHFEIEKDNFSPLYTVAIFDFFINPKIEDIYQIGINKIKSMRYIIRIIRNICFKTKFDKDDKCSEFNSIIEKLNLKLSKFISSKILSINVDNKDELNSSLSSNDSIGIDVPIFLYEFDWRVISTLLSLNKELIDAYK